MLLNMPIQILDREIISLLISIGLSEREARLYYVLLSEGENRVREIANLSGVPEPHVYSLLKSMHSKGTVEILQAGVRKYRAIPLDLVVDSLIGEKERALISLKNEGRKIAQSIKVDEKRIQRIEIKLIIGLEDMVKKAMEMLQGVKKDILAITSASMLLTHIEYLPFWINIKSRGVNLRVLIYPDVKKIERLKPITNAGAQIKFFTQKNVHHKLIVDESVALIYVNCEEQIKPLDFGFWTNHNEIAKRSMEKFEELWDQATIYK